MWPAIRRFAASPSTRGCTSRSIAPRSVSWPGTTWRRRHCIRQERVRWVPRARIVVVGSSQRAASGSRRVSSSHIAVTSSSVCGSASAAASSRRARSLYRLRAASIDRSVSVVVNVTGRSPPSSSQVEPGGITQQRGRSAPASASTFSARIASSLYRNVSSWMNAWLDANGTATSQSTCRANAHHSRR